MAAELFVWLMPTPRDTTILAPRIERLAQELGSPTFAPHVTMCTEPGVTTLAAVGSLSELPLSLAFTSLEFGGDYSHGCYLTAKNDKAARDLQARCVATLGGHAPQGYPPHLSLAYGVLNEAQRAAAKAICGDLPLQVSADRLELWASDGPVSSWRKLA
jgi:2'-5' RNA ligase